MEESQKVVDMVNQPPHYTDAPVECIEIARHLPYDWGNALKYQWRESLKEGADTDESKSLWYIRDALYEDCDIVIAEARANTLNRKLSLCLDYFSAEKYTLLASIISAAAGNPDARSALTIHLIQKGTLPEGLLEAFQ